MIRNTLSSKRRPPVQFRLRFTLEVVRHGTGTRANYVYETPEFWVVDPLAIPKPGSGARQGAAGAAEHALAVRLVPPLGVEPLRGEVVVRAEVAVLGLLEELLAADEAELDRDAQVVLLSWVV